MAADTREFESLCKDLFGQGRACVGLTDDVAMGQGYLLLHSPIPRKVSKSCLNMVKEDTEGELLFRVPPIERLQCVPA